MSRPKKELLTCRQGKCVKHSLFFYCYFCIICHTSNCKPTLPHCVESHTFMSLAFTVSDSEGSLMVSPPPPPQLRGHSGAEDEGLSSPNCYKL